MTSVSDIAENKPDSAGATIVSVYAKRPPIYAVYQTQDRLLVQFSDDPSVEATQRSVLAKLNPLRNDINGLIDGWHKRWSKNLRARAKRYERRVADALIEALEDDSDGARALLQETKDQIVGERTSWARFLYLIIASGVCVLSIALLAPVTPDAAAIKPPTPAALLLLGAASGAVGAFFSIAIAIHSRTILTDLYFWNNSADAVLRIVIGEIAGALLIALLLSKAVTLSLGAGSIAADGKSWLPLVLAGFVAGFSERLIPDLLNKAAAAGTPATAASSSPRSGKPDDSAQASASQPISADATEDTCLSATGIGSDEATHDADLPKPTS